MTDRGRQYARCSLAIDILAEKKSMLDLTRTEYELLGGSLALDAATKDLAGQLHFATATLDLSSRKLRDIAFDAAKNADADLDTDPDPDVEPFVEPRT